MSQPTQTRLPVVNGIDLEALMGVVEAVKADPAVGMAEFCVATSWSGQTRSETRVASFRLGGQDIPRPYRFETDEPAELLGSNSAPNPQELLMGALNACMLVGYVANAALRGVTLEKLEIETEGTIDLRGFLGLDASVNPGYDTLRYTVRIKGDGTPAQYREIHEAVQKTSPNYMNLARPVRMESELVVE